MNLLVAGDSFSQFPNQWYGSERPIGEVVEYPSSTRGDGFTITYDFDHWAQLYAKEHNCNATSVGLGAGDISSTTSIALRYLLSNNFTHCIFFITHFGREYVQVRENSPLDNCLNADSIDVENFYVGNGNTQFYESMKYVHRHPTDKSVHQLIGPNWYHDTDEMKGKYKDRVDTYLDLVSFNAYVHNRLSNLSLLATVCKKHNIKLIFACPFDGMGSLPWIKDYIHNEMFVYSDVVPQDILNREVYKWCTSHYTGSQHNLIYSKFRRFYPDWWRTDD